jgi:hypothetical protein
MWNPFLGRPFQSGVSFALQRFGEYISTTYQRRPRDEGHRRVRQVSWKNAKEHAMKAVVRHSRGLRWSVAAVLACLCASPAATQDPSLKPTYGSVNLKAGFEPDPYVKKLDAGGPIQTKLGGVTAWVAKEPDFRLNYTAGNFPLIIRAECKEDTTLLINLPNGQWVANDDGPNGLNPLLRFAKPMSGQYDIWVGTFKKGGTPPATLIISEIDGPGGVKPKPKPKGNAPDPSLNPTYGAVNLKAGFEPDPFKKKLDAGGPIRTNLGNVNAFVARAPDFRLNYTAGKFALTFQAESKADTTLLINLPNGQWIANDDGENTGLNPMIRLAKPMSGQYDVWVGTFGQETAPATLIITELK